MSDSDAKYYAEDKDAQSAYQEYLASHSRKSFAEIKKEKKQERKTFREFTAPRTTDESEKEKLLAQEREKLAREEKEMNARHIAWDKFRADNPLVPNDRDSYNKWIELYWSSPAQETKKNPPSSDKKESRGKGKRIRVEYLTGGTIKKDAKGIPVLVNAKKNVIIADSYSDAKKQILNQEIVHPTRFADTDESKSLYVPRETRSSDNHDLKSKQQQGFLTITEL